MNYRKSTTSVIDTSNLHLDFESEHINILKALWLQNSCLYKAFVVESDKGSALEMNGLKNKT